VCLAVQGGAVYRGGALPPGGGVRRGAGGGGRGLRHGGQFCALSRVVSLSPPPWPHLAVVARVAGRSLTLRRTTRRGRRGMMASRPSGTRSPRRRRGVGSDSLAMQCCSLLWVLVEGRMHRASDERREQISHTPNIVLVAHPRPRCSACSAAASAPPVSKPHSKDKMDDKSVPR
jgi:hypothetical protein